MDATLVVRICSLCHLSDLGRGVALLHHHSGHSIRRRQNKEVVDFAAHRSHLFYPTSSADQSE